MSDKRFLPALVTFCLTAGLICLLCLSPVTADAQQSGEITGRVVTDDGKGASRVSVVLYPAGSRQGGVPSSHVALVTTDEDGNFRFTDLTPRVYQVSVSQTKEYVLSPMLDAGEIRQNYYRVGDNVTITLSRGGVITGRVTTPEGDPMVGGMVSATMLRDAGGNRVRQFTGRPRLTDDRGIYRLYGLAPGVYVVSASAASLLSPPLPDAKQVKAYHPSSTADTATEVTVASGGEVTGIDIALRNDRGYAVSGTVVGSGNPSSPYLVPTVSLVNLATGSSLNRSANRVGNSNGFAFDDVSDGEYEIVARRGGDNSAEDFASSPRGVTVKGSDISGIELRLATLVSISGKVVIEPSAGLCESKNRFGKEEILLFPRRKEILPQSSPAPVRDRSYDVGDDGEFTLSSLEAGTYHIESLLPDENWYLRSITIPSPATGRGATVATAGVSLSSGINLKSGKPVTGVTLVVAEGAAGLQGRILAEKEGSPLPARLRIHLVPVEPAAANDLLRYAETLTRGEGAFEFKNLAPGKYWITARAVDDQEGANRLPVSWDDTERARLRTEAETLKNEVVLKPCQRISGQVVRFN